MLGMVERGSFGSSEGGRALKEFSMWRKLVSVLLRNLATSTIRTSNLLHLSSLGTFMSSSHNLRSVKCRERMFLETYQFCQ